MKTAMAIAGIAGLFFMTAATKITNAPRGIRNNNAGNIRGSATVWNGEVGRDDKDFVVFESPEYGIRAIGKVIDTYRKKYGIETIAGIVARWAPSNENDTSAYIRSVEKQTGIDAGMLIDRSHYPAIVKAIIRHENGRQPYSDQQINAGLMLV